MCVHVSMHVCTFTYKGPLHLEHSSTPTCALNQANRVEMEPGSSAPRFGPHRGSQSPGRYGPSPGRKHALPPRGGTEKGRGCRSKISPHPRTDVFGLPQRSTWFQSLYDSRQVNLSLFNIFSPITKLIKIYSDCCFIMEVLRVKGRKLLGRMASFLKAFQVEGTHHLVLYRSWNARYQTKS